MTKIVDFNTNINLNNMGFNLSDLLEEGEDSLYGRKEGAAYAKKNKIT